MPNIQSLVKGKYSYLLLCLAIFIIHIALFWPGILSPDSQGQYDMAIKGIYSDHHPFMMSWLWRYLDMIYSGPGLLFILHLSLLHASTWFIAQCFDNNKIKYLITFIPFIPQILVYSGMIWKDVAFAYCFLCVCSVLSYVTLRDYKLKFWQILLLLAILLYGTMVKFQAQYLAPIVLVWFGICLSRHSTRSNTFFKTVDVITVFYMMMGGIYVYGPKIKQDHYWQYVKLYDLAAISVKLDQSIIPEFNQTAKYSMLELKQRFNHQRVDDLISSGSILQMGTTAQQRDKLLDIWKQQIVHHPWIYLQHRLMNMAYALLSMPKYDEVQKWIMHLSKPGSNFNSVLNTLTRMIGFFILAHLLVVCLCICYIALAIKVRHLTSASIPLLFMNMISVGMLSVLFFCTMAGTPRYTYIVVCLTHCSHGFAYLCYQALKSSKKQAVLSPII